MPTVRGLRNNNPLNIRVGNHWQGEIPVSERTDAQARETEFEVFRTMADGIRAGYKILHRYQHTYGLRTVAEIIGRWAPPSENATHTYASTVARAMGIGADTPISLDDPVTACALIRAMATVECGTPPGDADIRSGLIKAGLTFPASSQTETEA